MSQAYSDPTRETDPHALPDVETFEVWTDHKGRQHNSVELEDGEQMADGWYYWYCFPGCLPDSEPNGPFDTEDEALEDARSNSLD